MLIVYTPESRANNGGVSGMNAVINAAVAKANLAFIHSKVGIGHVNWAFSVVVDIYADGNITFAHEVGHNFGCGHGMGNGGGVFGSSNGHRFNAQGQTYRTVMAYAPGIRILHFSSYSQHYAGVTLGTASAQNNITLQRGRSGNASLFLGAADMTVAAQGDLNGDNKPDLIWQHV